MKRFAEIALWKQLVISCLFYVLANSTIAQDIPVGSWRTHFSYSNARILEFSDSKLFCAVENGLFSVDLLDLSTRKLSKLDGLTDAKVTAMKFNEDLNVLVIGYESGLVDFIFEDGIQTLKEIFDSNLVGEKKINAIEFFEGQTFLATGLGIVSVITDQVRVRESFVQIGPEGAEVTATELLVVNNDLLAKTDTTVQLGDLNSNLLDFNNWRHFTGTADLTSLVANGESIYAKNGSNLLLFNGEEWSEQPVTFSGTIERLKSIDGEIYLISGQEVFLLSENFLLSQGDFQVETINDFVFLNGAIWIASSDKGLISELEEFISPDGPVDDDFSRLTYLRGSLYGFHAPDPSTYNGDEQTIGYSIFESGVWTTPSIEGFYNVSSVATFMDKTYFGSIGDGLINTDDDEIITNIPGSNGATDTVITSIDSRENLWVSSYNNDNPLHVFDGSNWNSITSTTVFVNNFIDLEISNQEVVWGLGDSGVIAAFSLEENDATILTSIPGSPNGIEISVADDGWVSSGRGPANFPNASFVFEEQNIVLPSFDNRTLFEDEVVNVIETDAGNQVWFGTNRGLWLFDESISEQVFLFNRENSPLASDVILDLEFNPRNGELFVLTDKGLLSYRSASSSGTSTHQDVAVFPNPVRPDYTGTVGINGLAIGVSLKVTDLSGNLVQDLAVSGGSSSWDLRNLKGEEVITGIYLLFSSTPDGIETFVGKLAVVR